jgi:hypothetical protein
LKRGCGPIIPLIGLIIFIGLFQLTRYHVDTVVTAKYALWYFGAMIVGFVVWLVLEMFREIDPDSF